jgi:hypothetical protein
MEAIRRCVMAGGASDEGRKYFPGIPQDFPNRGDLRVVRALARMAWMLHGPVAPSARWPGHRMRLKDHQHRIREKLAAVGQP